MSDPVLSAPYGLSPAGAPLTEEEARILCRRDPVNARAILTPEGRRLAASWPRGKFADEVMAYATATACGEKIAGADRILACIRFLTFLERPDFDVRTQDADFVIGIVQTTFRHRQGETLDAVPLRGKPLILEPWEKFIVYGILVFYHKGTSERVVKEALVFVPRKNGKTSFISGLSYGIALLERASGAKVYVVAETLKQARETFDSWLYNITGTLYRDKKAAVKAGWRIVDNNMEHAISNGDIAGGSVSLNALAGREDNLDSFNCSVGIVDEIHAFKSAAKYNRIREASKAYTNKLTVAITTAGDNGMGFCAQRVDYCRKVLRGLVDDDQYFIFLCSADKGEDGDVDFTSPIQHEKANPNYGVTIRPQDILNDAIQAQNDPQQRKDFLSRSLNIFTSSVRSYFNVDEFKRSNDAAELALGIQPGWTLKQKLRHLASLPVQWYGGADLSKLHDLTAAALHGQYKGIDIVIPHAWFPVVAAAEKADHDNIPLFGWQEDGWLTLCNAPTNDHMSVVKWFLEMKKMGFRIKQVGHDRKFCREYFLGMKRAGFAIIDQPQYFYRKSEGFRHIEKQAKNNRLYFLGAEPYLYCVSNVAAVEKTDDMVQFSKVMPEQRIDVFDADVFACCRMLESMERSSEASKWIDRPKSGESADEA